MGAWRWLARRVRPADEAGYVIVLAMMVMVIALGLLMASTASTLSQRESADRQLRIKRALQAADAGLQTALYRWNQLNLAGMNFTSGAVTNVGNLADCVIPSVGVSGTLTFNTVAIGSSATASSTCPNPSSSGVPNPIPDVTRIGDHAFYYLQYIPGGSTSGPIHKLSPSIVVTGVDDGGNSSTCSSSLTASAGQTGGCVVERVKASLAPIDPFELIEASGNLTIGGSGLRAVTALGDVRTNGNVTINALSYTGTDLFSTPVGILPNITYGGTKSVPLATTANQNNVANTVNRAAITISPSKPDCTDSTGATVTCSTVLGSAYTGTATDSLNLSSGTLTLSPGDYVFCNVNITGGTILANPTASAPVRIYVDSPTSSRCSGDGLGSAQGNFTDTPGFGLVSTAGSLVSQVGALAAGGQFQVYLASTGTVQIGSSNPLALQSVTQSMFLYAPNSTVTVGTTIFDGNIVGKNVTVYSTTLSQNLGLNNYSLANGVGVFHVNQYAACTPVWPPGATATSGC